MWGEKREEHERDWLGNGAQSSMYYTKSCTMWTRLKNSMEATDPKSLIHVYEEK